MLSASKLFPSTSACWLTFLFLLIIGNHHVNGTSTCPYRLLQSAFKVQVDLEENTEVEGKQQQQQVVCSTDEKNGLAELIEKGIQKASKKVVENSKRFSFDDESGASVCKVPEDENGEEENRRLDNQLLISVRNLKSYLKFRYYGSMRCSLCKKDDGDNGIFYSTIEAGEYSLAWRTSPRTLRVPVPGKAEGMRLEFVIREMGGFQGQHIFVKINKKTVDLGEFYEALNEGKRDKKNNGRYVWTMKPDSTGQRHAITIYLPKAVFLGKKYLDVNLLYGGMVSDSDNKELSAEFGTQVYLSYFWYTIKRRRLVSSPVSSPTVYSSPVSSPTTTYSSSMVANPASSPVVAEIFKIEKNIDNSNVAKADGSSGSESLVNPSSPRLPNAGGVDNNANTRNSKRKSTKSNSNNLVFRNLVRDTLTSILNNDLKVVISKPGHCMFGEEIKAVVHLTPKPEWEMNLPTCSYTNKFS